jgi:hypothetical protein
MPDQFIQIANASNLKLDASELVVGANTVERQRMVIADPTNAANFALVSSTGALTTVISDGTNTANVIAGSTGQNALVTARGRKEVSFTTTIVATVANTDVSNYSWVSVQINTQGTSSTVNFQGSNDNTNWVTVSLVQTTAGGSVPIYATTSSAALFSGPLNFRYFQLSVTGISAGTTSGVVEYFSIAPPQIAGLVTWCNQNSPPWSTYLAKKTQILTTSLLTSSATYTSGWNDTSVTGTNFVTSTLFSTNVGIANGNWSVQESDDSSNSSMTRTAFSLLASTSAASVALLTSQVKCRYWRIVVVNGATAMTGTFELTATETNAQPFVTVVDPGNGAYSANVNLANDNLSQFYQANIATGFMYAYNGTSTNWDRVRIKPSSTAAVAADEALVVTVSPNTPVILGGGQCSLNPATSGGLLTTKLISAASTNATSVKATAGQVYNVQAFNTGATAAFLKLYNLAVAPTVGTSVPVNVWMIPAGAGVVIELTNGLALATGIAISVQGGITDTDTTAVTLSQCVVNLQYK